MEDNRSEQDFCEQNKRDWAAAITTTFGDAPPTSAMWDRPDIYPAVLSAFMGQNLNHTHLPRGGGLDMQSVANSHEAGCMEFSTIPSVADVFCPGKLYFEFFEKSPGNSFFLLENRVLKPSGIYDTKYTSEEVIELSPGQYEDRSYIDQGHLGHDSSGQEIPLPDSYRRISRELAAGQFLVIAKQSLWNLDPGTYDGRHNKMTHDEIRQCIQAGLSL